MSGCLSEDACNFLLVAVRSLSNHWVTILGIGEGHGDSEVSDGQEELGLELWFLA